MDENLRSKRLLAGVLQASGFEVIIPPPHYRYLRLSGRICIPTEAFIFVDAYLGPGINLDDLIEELRILARVDSHIMATPRSRVLWSECT